MLVFRKLVIQWLPVSSSIWNCCQVAQPMTILSGAECVDPKDGSDLYVTRVHAGDRVVLLCVALIVGGVYFYREEFII